MAADKRSVVAFHLAVLQAIELSKANGRAEVTIYYTGPVSRSSAYDYVVSLDPTGTMLSRPVCSVRAPEISVRQARGAQPCGSMHSPDDECGACYERSIEPTPPIRCVWCGADITGTPGEVRGFCSTDCESTYNNTAGDRCDICGEPEDECACDEARDGLNEDAREALLESYANDDVCQTTGCGHTRRQHDMEVVCMVEECECPGFTTEPADAEVAR